MQRPRRSQILGEVQEGASSWSLISWQVPVAQLRQTSVQDSRQQTPSVQKPDLHSLVLLQTLPLSLLVGAGGLPQAPAPLQVAVPHSRS